MPDHPIVDLPDWDDDDEPTTTPVMAVPEAFVIDAEPDEPDWAKDGSHWKEWLR